MPAQLWLKGVQMKIKTSTLPAGLPVRLYLAVAAIFLSLLAIPHAAYSQGIVRGAQQGAAEGNRVAGPVGGVVGGAVGAGVGGAMGAVKGVFGILTAAIDIAAGDIMDAAGGFTVIGKF